MAAHVLTALNQIKDNQVNFNHLQSALNLSTWTEDLDFNDYCDLSEIVKKQDTTLLNKWIDNIELKYIDKWFNLGKPATREQWRASLYK